MARWLNWVAAAACVLAGCSGEPTGDDTSVQCSSWTDCVDVKLTEGGRCFPAEKVCDGGECRRRCRALCETLEPRVTSCEEPLVCDQSENDETGACVANPIECSTAADCPLFLPTDEAGAAWSCEEGLCVFPGFSFGAER